MTEQTIIMIVFGTFGGMLGATIVQGILTVVQYFSNQNKIIRQIDLEKALARQEQLMHTLITSYQRTGGLKVTDDLSLVNQYYGEQK